MEIEIDDILEDLIGQLSGEGFEHFYTAKVQGHYKSRCFEELLITLFVSSDEFPEDIFKNWFRKNNNILQQESFSFECNNVMFVEEL